MQPKATCPYCGRSFTPRLGGRPQVYCCVHCKNERREARVAWVEEMEARGTVSVADERAALGRKRAAAPKHGKHAEMARAA